MSVSVDNIHAELGGRTQAYFDVEAFRNIATAIPSVSVFDDLVGDQNKRNILNAWDQITTYADTSERRQDRPFLYGNKLETVYVFDRLESSRFSNGAFGVWYGATSEECSVWETLHGCYRYCKEDLPNSSNGKIRVHRRMYEARLACQTGIDLRALVDWKEDLTHPLSYGFTNRLGIYARENGVDLYFTPSARLEGGVCLPVFTQGTVLLDKPRYEYFLTFDQKTAFATIEKLGEVKQEAIPKEVWDLPLSF